MMKLILFLVFLMPLSFLVNFWLMQFFLLIITFFFLFNVSFIMSYISFNMGYDMISYFLILLSFWICLLMILASEKIYLNNNYYKMFIFMVLLLLLSLIMTFIVMNLFLFYLFFEISLIPTLILIIGWGYQPERIQAGMYLLFYTMFMSLPMMLIIFYLYNLNYSLDFIFLNLNLSKWYMYMCMNMVFLVKMPMFMLHLWLPKAHVEAPVSGSMILAGIMLKLGGYGLMRFLKLFLDLGMKINLVFIIISLLGGVIVSFICIRQSDMKMLIAYSSVAHMGMVLSGIMSLTCWGMMGAFIMMIAHGLCSSGLFVLANILYERMSSRSLYLNKGLINIMPSLSMWWFLFCVANMAAPPSLNLLGEIFIINSLVNYSYFFMFLLMLLSFFSAVYSLFLYSFSQHGMFYSGLFSFWINNIREFLLLFLHWFPLNLLILKSDLFF
uniref:NADH-ubiquinone oxidoreductase chain 4 n=1 Tax=Endomychus coccineus TaxID=295833 RepID=S4SUB8_9CUCU|nr:NADH dehydrogenase subunit 4 [Endomychus coccineus]